MKKVTWWESCNMSTILAPFYELLKNKAWNWGLNQKEAFKKVKEMLQSSFLLVHFDNDKKVIFFCIHKKKLLDLQRFSTFSFQWIYMF